MSTNSFDRKFVITNLETYKELISDNNPCAFSPIQLYGEKDRRKADELLKHCLLNSRK